MYFKYLPLFKHGLSTDRRVPIRIENLLKEMNLIFQVITKTLQEVEDKKLDHGEIQINAVLNMSSIQVF